jgi:RNA:NAD 2'-phosphotransferase (TPT1/KptA family)
MPLDVFCQTCHLDSYNFIDDCGKEFYEFHPSIRQHVSWLKTVLKDKVAISDNTINIAMLIIEESDKFHNKFKYNKAAFSNAVAVVQQYPPEFIKKTNWPRRPLGY